MKILLVEDDPRLSRSLARLLEQDRHNVEVAPDGETGLDIALGENGIDVVILDIGLPDISGLDVARRIREEGRELAILMLTARDTVDDRVTGLDSGADDYVGPSRRLRPAAGAVADEASSAAEPRLAATISLDETSDRHRQRPPDDLSRASSPSSSRSCATGQALTRDGCSTRPGRSGSR
jgi:CheY-like chemotaxis protein